MGMRGYYFAMDDNLVQQIVTGDIALNSLKIDDYPGLDIDRSWEAIHYLLCGVISDGDAPLSYVVPLTSDKGIDFGSFGAFSLRAKQVAEAHQVISELDEAQLRLRYDFRPWLRKKYILLNLILFQTRIRMRSLPTCYSILTKSGVSTAKL